MGGGEKEKGDTNEISVRIAPAGAAPASLIQNV
jgi:hypothetical protein